MATTVQDTARCITFSIVKRCDLRRSGLRLDLSQADAFFGEPDTSGFECLTNSNGVNQCPDCFLLHRVLCDADVPDRGMDQLHRFYGARRPRPRTLIMPVSKKPNDDTGSRLKLDALATELQAQTEDVEVDPFDDAMLAATLSLIELAKTHSTTFEQIRKTVSKLERSESRARPRSEKA